MDIKSFSIVFFVTVLLLLGGVGTAQASEVRESELDTVPGTERNVDDEEQVKASLDDTGADYVRSDKSGMLDSAGTAVIEMEVWIDSRFMSEDGYGHLGGVTSGEASTDHPDIEFGFRKNHRENGPNTLDVIIDLGGEEENNHHYWAVFMEGDHDNEWIDLRAEYGDGELEVFVNDESYGTSQPEGQGFGDDQDNHFYLSNPNDPASFIGRMARAELRVDGDESLLWSIKEGDGDVVYDLSGNENHGLIGGTEWIEEDVHEGYSLEFMKEYEIEILKPIMTVPKIQERGKEVKIWVRNPMALNTTTWGATLFKEYSDQHVEEFEMEIINVEEAEDRRGEDNWYLIAVVPEDASEELYDLRVSDGEVDAKSIQSVDVVDEINDQFSFVSAPDPHIGYVDDGEPAAVNRFRRFVHEMNLVRPDFVTLEGDISDKEPLWWADQDPYPTEQDEKVYELVQELEVPVYVVHGNHDYSYVNDEDPNYNIQSYREWINPHLNYTFTYGEDYHFTMQNSGKYVALINSDGLMTMDNVTWMEKVLEENQDKTMRFVHQHHPVYPDTLDDSDVTDAFRETVIDQNVTAVLAGHIHTNRDIYDAEGNDIPGDPTEGERPLHVSTGDLVKSMLEYRLVRIDGDEIESMTYDLDGDGERDDKAGIPLGDISVDHTPANDGTNTEVVATIENDLYEHFDDAVVKFNVDSPEPGQRYYVENATPFEMIDTGEEKHIYARTDIDRDSTKQVSVRQQHFIETFPASSVDMTSATLRGRIPDLGETGEVFFRYREYGEDTWMEKPIGSKSGPENFSAELSDLEMLQKYEFKAGIEIDWHGETIEKFGDTLVFVPAELTHTTQLREDWEVYQEIDDVEFHRNDLVLKPVEEYRDTFEFTGEDETVSVSNITHLDVELMGAGGGGPTGTGTRGGDGGKVIATLNVSDFDEITVWIGEGGEGAEGSDDYGEGGWGRHSGGDGYDASDISISRGSGGGGGSTEIVADDGTFLAAADAGGGGGYEGSQWTFGGGGGARGGLGGEDVDEPAEGEGYGGHGGDPDGHVHGDPDGQPGGAEINESYVVGDPIIQTGGGNDGGGVAYDGDDGHVLMEYDEVFEEAHRISEPLPLEGIVSAGMNRIVWNSTEPVGTEVNIYTAVTESNDTVPANWTEAENGEEIQSIEKGEDLTDEYLWTKQVLTSEDEEEIPRIHDMSIGITNAEPAFFEVYDVEAENTVEGENLKVTATVENTGEITATQTIDMVSDVGEDSREEQLDGGESRILTFTTGTSPGDAGDHTAMVSSEDDSAQDDFEILARYELTIEPGVGGEVVRPGEDTFEYTAGEEVELEADPDEDWYFVEWTGDTDEIADVRSKETTIEMRDHYTIQPRFEEYVELTIEEIDGEGVIKIDDSEIGSGDYPYQERYEEGTEITLTAEPYEGWYFVDWTGDVPSGEEESETIKITMDEDKVLQANFAIHEYDLNITVEGEGSTEPSEGDHTYEHGEKVTIQAAAAEGWYFVEWTGDVPSGEEENETFNITMDEDRSVTANFEIQEYDLDVWAEGGGSVDIDPEQTEYEHGTLVNLTADPDEGWYFEEWTGDHEGTEEEMTITMDGDKELIAWFEEDPAIFEVEIIVPEDGSEIEKDEEVTVEYTVVNMGGMKDNTQDIVIRISNDDGKTVYNDTEEDVTLASDENYTGEFTWEPEEAGTYEIEISCDDDSTKIDIEVEESGHLRNYWWLFLLIILAVVISIFLILWSREEEEEEDEDLPPPAPMNESEIEEEEDGLEESDGESPDDELDEDEG